jgi:hypothetical protein
MKRYTAENPLLAKYFCSDFQEHVRYSVSRLDRLSPDAGYEMYAQKYGLDYEYVKNLAIIGGEVREDILQRMGLEARGVSDPSAKNCSNCGHLETETVFISR